MSRLLLCPPDFYGIEYEINPWMQRARKADAEQARAQWKRLHETLERLGARIEVIAPQPRLPDMVFTANAGIVMGRRFVLSNFRFKERQGEAEYFRRWFEQHEYQVNILPSGLVFEGEGDALFCGDTLFCGYRFRSDIDAHLRLAELFQCRVISVELVDPRFYHLDTCFCPLPDGGAVWFPAAFDEYGRRTIRDHARGLIEVPAEEAARFTCNAVILGRDIVLPEGCPQTQQQLSDRGCRCHPVLMTEFMKAGGACKCLTLFLDRPGG